MNKETAVSLHGQHIVGGVRIASNDLFLSDPAIGDGHAFCIGTPALVDQACRAAEEAFHDFGARTRAQRADLLETIADEITARAEIISDIASRETGLPLARLQGERSRTEAQLRIFADHIRTGNYLDRRHDVALPARQPLPRPDLRMVQRPVGPVAVFGASNFPLAFSVAGGDTASALAAGCPVIVRAHPAHPGTSEIVAEAVVAALVRCGMHPGVFALIQGPGHAIGEALVAHPLVRAVGFTGSLAGGRALFDRCMARPDPIPFFGELGSVNPVFVLPAALQARGTALGREWAASLALGAGQFCTNPGIAVAPCGKAAEAFIAAALAGLTDAPAQTMLTTGIATAFQAGCQRVGHQAGVQTVLASPCRPRAAVPHLFRVTAAEWLRNDVLAEEVFGPLGLVVTVDSPAQMDEVARALAGQLTATVQIDEADMAQAGRLLPVLERKAGRLLVNGFPTGVEVCDAMVHGGPFPASTNFGATSVGSLAIRRWLRPVCYQNFPDALLPEDLRRGPGARALSNGAR
jgi:alpha-ketoglutaric semialdehyde dehydrogenase